MASRQTGSAQARLASVKEASQQHPPLSRHLSSQSCPAHVKQPSYCEEIMLCAEEAAVMKKCISAPVQGSAVSPIPTWPGCEVKVRNTFLHVEEDGDEEFAFLQACRRRDTHSCPFLSAPAGPAPDAASEPAAEPSPERQLVAAAEPAGAARQETFDQPASRTAGSRHSRGRRGSRAANKVAAPKCDAALIAKAASPAAAAEPEFEPEEESQLETAGRGLARARRGSRRGACLWCHVFIDPVMLEPQEFHLVKKLIGRSGCNTSGIFEATGTKVRVRGRGSGHAEERGGREAPVPLMVALAAQHGRPDGFRDAFVRTRELLQDVSRRFAAFLRQRRREVPAGPRFWVGAASSESLAYLSDADLDGVQVKVSSNAM